MIIEKLEERLLEYENKQLYRERHVRTHEEQLINFSSNDYLGLSQHPDIIKNFQTAAEKYGIGSGASQLVAGHTDIHQECETAFAEFLGRDRALLFGNGYMANLGVIDALTDIGDRIYEDRYNHASLLDGARLSNAKLIRYSHKNKSDLLERMTNQNTGKKLIATDGVFSMYGDIAPLDRLATLSKKQGATLMVDDAHGIGVLGATGRGTLEHFNLTQNDVPILNCPLGKAFGSYGAIVAGNKTLIESLIQFSRSYIYTTALPPAIASALIKSLEVMQKETWRREKLQHLITFFRKEAKTRDIALMDSETAIQAILVGTPENTLLLSQQLKQQGFWVYPMRPPSVPEGQSILRITLSALHTEEAILSLLDAIQ